MFTRVLLFASAVAAIATPRPDVAAPAAKNFKFFGINESGPEFGEKNFTGVKGKEVNFISTTNENSSDNLQYVWPKLSTTDAFIGKGMNTFRINILAERGVVGKDQKGPFAQAYINDLKTVCMSNPFLSNPSHNVDCGTLHR